MESWLAVKKRRIGLNTLPVLVEDPAELEAEGWSTAEIEIGQWIDENLHGKPRPIKTPQLYLWGPPSVGKSTLILTLAKFKSVYVAPQDEDFYDHFDERYTDLVVFDEFKGKQKSLQWMNSFLDGSEVSIRKKGLQSIKTKNLPVLVASNFPPMKAYEQASARGSPAFVAFMTRLRVVELSTYAEKLIGALERAVQITSLPSNTSAPEGVSSQPCALDSTTSSKNTLCTETSRTGTGSLGKNETSETGDFELLTGSQALPIVLDDEGDEDWRASQHSAYSQDLQDWAERD